MAKTSARSTKLKDTASLKYDILLHPLDPETDGDEGYCASIPTFGNGVCSATGKNPAEALKNLAAAKDAFFASLAEKGIGIPKPRSEKDCGEESSLSLMKPLTWLAGEFDGGSAVYIEPRTFWITDRTTLAVKKKECWVLCYRRNQEPVRILDRQTGNQFFPENTGALRRAFFEDEISDYIHSVSFDSPGECASFWIARQKQSDAGGRN